MCWGQLERNSTRGLATTRSSRCQLIDSAQLHSLDCARHSLSTVGSVARQAQLAAVHGAERELVKMLKFQSDTAVVQIELLQQQLKSKDTEVPPPPSLTFIASSWAPEIRPYAEVWFPLCTTPNAELRREALAV